MFQIELKFKIHERNVSWETFAAAFVSEALKPSFDEIRPKFAAVPMAPPSLPSVEAWGQKVEPKIVNVDAAAHLLGIRPSTVRAYISRRKIASVRIGRRVLIPTVAIDELISSGLRPAAPR